MNKKLLVIFVKQARLGKVKTRLARGIGDEKALEIYQYLLEHSAKLSMDVQADKWVYYSPEIEFNDAFPKPLFHKKKQVDGDLGERMLAAFQEGFEAGYQHIVLIGSDIYELKSSIIEKAFKALEKNETVFGPAKDGGYYLVGLKKAIPSIFLNKKWSHSRVLDEALAELKNLNYSYQLVNTLHDIDEEKDLPCLLKEKFNL